jgi:hypothetical protein
MSCMVNSRGGDLNNSLSKQYPFSFLKNKMKKTMLFKGFFHKKILI